MVIFVMTFKCLKQQTKSSHPHGVTSFEEWYNTESEDQLCLDDTRLKTEKVVRINE